MAPAYCCVPGCFANSKDDTNTSFFSFPLQEDRCYQWVRNCGRHDLLEKTPLQLRKSYRMCAMHFDDSMFSGKTMTRLKPHAVPIVCGGQPTIASVSIDTSSISEAQLTPDPQPSTSFDQSSIPHLPPVECCDMYPPTTSKVQDTTQQTPLSLTADSPRKHSLKLKVESEAFYDDNDDYHI